MIGYHMRYCLPIQKIKSILDGHRSSKLIGSMRLTKNIIDNEGFKGSWREKDPTAVSHTLASHLVSILVELFGSNVLNILTLEYLNNNSSGDSQSILIKAQDQRIDIQALASWRMPRTSLSIDLYQDYEKIKYQNGVIEWKNEDPTSDKSLTDEVINYSQGLTIEESLKRFLAALNSKKDLCFSHVEEGIGFQEFV